jgi:uncharacterized integral membrane protein
LQSTETNRQAYEADLLETKKKLEEALEDQEKKESKMKVTWVLLITGIICC